MSTLQKQLASKAVSSLEGRVLGVIDSAGGMQKMHKAGVAAVHSARLNPQGSLDEIPLFEDACDSDHLCFGEITSLGVRIDTSSGENVV
mgnify:CR=1 FL=1